MKKIFCIILVLALSLCFVCCKAPNNDDKTSQDYITIKEVAKEGDKTLIKVEYMLSAFEEGEIMVGCKDPATKEDYIIFETKKGVVVIKKGKGEYVFSVETSQIISDELCADLSEYPHPSTWEPIATDYFYIGN